MTQFVIIGAGIAGLSAAEEIRKRDPEASIVLISEEFHPTYSRVLLPHYIKGSIPREKVFLRSEAWYHEKNLELMLGVRVLGIDPQNKFVRTSDDREIPY